jgi:ligand-binding SRPBCC domain-containing protein
MKQKIVHEIVEFEPLHRFVEQQVHGPLKFYRHEHVVRAHDGRGIQLIDRIEFQPPGGLAGMLLTESRILKGLQHAFEHRRRELKKHLEGMT